MKVSHLNTFPYGGAANAALRLHHQMMSDGIQSSFLYTIKDRDEPDGPGVHKISWRQTPGRRNPISKLFEKRRQRRIYSLYDDYLADRDEDLELFSMPELVEQTVFQNSSPKQIIHLHWLAFMVDYPTFFNSIPATTPIVWTLHDMNPFTGGCHYSGGCDQFIQGCGYCPLVDLEGPKDISRQGFNTKRQLLRRKDLTIVAPSEWMLNLAKSSPIFSQSTNFHHIRLGFDLQTLYPINKQTARKLLGLKSQKILIGFGCESINNPRKGFDLLLASLKALPNQSDVECVVFGSGIPENLSADIPKIHNLGFIDDPKKLTQFYSACDFVVVPSREDNQPQVGLEAMACGTPVVAFDVGGIGEYVKPGITGWLARSEKTQDLCVQMTKLIVDSDSRQVMGRRCRQMMQQDFDIVQQSKKYVQLYQSLLNSAARKAA